MHYDTALNNHGMEHDPFKAIVSPRPVGWISTVDASGRTNLAPYSFFNGIGNEPPMVMFCSTGWKDSVSNIAATGEFVCNFASYDLKDAMNESSAPVAHEVSEFELTGLEAAPSFKVRVPRVAAAKAALECRHLQTIRLKDLNGHETDTWMVMGQVVSVYIDDSAIVNGRFDVTVVKPLSRLGYMDFSAVESVFEMKRPKG